MCLHPIKIRNKGLLHNPGLLSLSVPCGHCKECQQQKKNEYFVRAYSVYKELFPDGKPSRWSAFFVTLTFDDEHLPRVSFARPVERQNDLYVPIGGEPMPCFNHELIRRFLKSFRQYYRRKFSIWHKALNSDTNRLNKVYDYIPSGQQLPRVLVTCEYGEKSHRPHYHCIIFVPEVISFKKFQLLLKRFWKYGFTSSFDFRLMDNQKQKRTPSAAIKYCTKYACKGSTWLPPYLDFRKTEYVPIGYLWSDITPRVFITDGFGTALESSLTPDNYKNNLVNFTINGKNQSYIIPSYYRRRYFTNIIVDEEYKVTQYVSNLVWIDGFNMLEDVPKKKVVLQRKTHSEYKNGFLDIKENEAFMKIKTLYFDFISMVSAPSQSFNQFLYDNNIDYSSILFCYNFTPHEFACEYMKRLWSNVPLSDDDLTEIPYYLESLVNADDIFSHALRELSYYQDYLLVQKNLMQKFKVKSELEFYKSHLISKIR